MECIRQAWWRKVQELGLSKDYKERTEVRKWIGYCFGLLFLGIKITHYFVSTISHKFYVNVIFIYFSV
jgi:hypothetical protein